MRSIFFTLALAVCILVLGSRAAAAQQTDNMEAVLAANRAFYEAASALDVARMEEVWAHAPYVSAVHPGQPIQKGWDEVRQGWVSLFSSFSAIEVAMPDPLFRIDGDAAWVAGKEAFSARMTSGKEVEETLLATSIFERSADGWRMVHHHVSVLPRQQ